jgi:hypothetical protein
LLVELSLLWLRVLINIDDLPLLSEIISISSASYLNVSVLGVRVKVLVLNLKDLTLIIDNETTFKSPDLPPS